jgi:hypothetical protein
MAEPTVVKPPHVIAKEKAPKVQKVGREVVVEVGGRRYVGGYRGESAQEAYERIRQERTEEAAAQQAQVDAQAQDLKDTASIITTARAEGAPPFQPRRVPTRMTRATPEELQRLTKERVTPEPITRERPEVLAKVRREREAITPERPEVLAQLRDERRITRAAQAIKILQVRKQARELGEAVVKEQEKELTTSAIFVAFPAGRAKGATRLAIQAFKNAAGTTAGKLGLGLATAELIGRVAPPVTERIGLARAKPEEREIRKAPEFQEALTAGFRGAEAGTTGFLKRTAAELPIVNLYVEKETDFKAAAKKYLSGRGVREERAERIVSEAVKVRKERSIGEGVTFLLQSAVVEITGAGVIGNTFKFAKAIPKKGAFGKVFAKTALMLFPAGAIEAGTQELAQERFRERPTDIKEVGIMAGIGGASAALIGGTIIGAFQRPVIRRGVSLAAYIGDPFEKPADILAEVTKKAVGKVRGRPFPKPQIIPTPRGFAFAFTPETKVGAKKVAPKAKPVVTPIVPSFDVAVKVTQPTTPTPTPTPVTPFTPVPVPVDVPVTVDTPVTTPVTTFTITPNVPTPVTTTTITPTTIFTPAITVTTPTPVLRIPPPLPLVFPTGLGQTRSKRSVAKAYIDELSAGGKLLDALIAPRSPAFFLGFKPPKKIKKKKRRRR